MFFYMSVKKVLQKASAIQKKSITLSSLVIVYIKALIPVFGCSFWQTMTLKSRKRRENKAYCNLIGMKNIKVL